MRTQYTALAIICFFNVFCLEARYKKTISFEDIVKAINTNNEDRIIRYVPFIKNLNQTEREQLRAMSLQKIKESENESKKNNDFNRNIHYLISALPIIIFGGLGIGALLSGGLLVFVSVLFLIPDQIPFMFGVMNTGLGLFPLALPGIIVGSILLAAGIQFFSFVSSFISEFFYEAPEQAVTERAKTIYQILLNVEDEIKPASSHDLITKQKKLMASL